MNDSPLDLRRYRPQATPDHQQFDDSRFDPDPADDDQNHDGWVGDWSDWSQPTSSDRDREEPAAPPGFRQVGRNFPPARPDRRGIGRVITALASTFAAVLVIIVVILEALPDGEDLAPSAGTPLAAPLTAPLPVVPSMTTPAHAIADCPQKRTVALSTGTDPGDTTSAVSVIFALQHAYYVDRSGSKARQFVTDDASVPPAETIQAGIDTVPVGTRYCVSIVPTSPARWQVQVREQRPDKPAELLATLIFTTTTEPDGTAKITSISEGP